MSKYLIASQSFFEIPTAQEIKRALDKLEEGDGENWRLHTIVGPLSITQGYQRAFEVYFQGEIPDKTPDELEMEISEWTKVDRSVI